LIKNYETINGTLNRLTCSHAGGLIDRGKQVSKLISWSNLTVRRVANNRYTRIEVEVKRDPVGGESVFV